MFGNHGSTATPSSVHEKYPGLKRKATLPTMICGEAGPLSLPSPQADGLSHRLEASARDTSLPRSTPLPCHCLALRARIVFYCSQTKVAAASSLTNPRSPKGPSGPWPQPCVSWEGGTQPGAATVCLVGAEDEHDFLCLVLLSY